MLVHNERNFDMKRKIISGLTDLALLAVCGSFIGLMLVIGTFNECYGGF